MKRKEKGDVQIITPLQSVTSMLHEIKAKFDDGDIITKIQAYGEYKQVTALMQAEIAAKMVLKVGKWYSHVTTLLQWVLMLPVIGAMT